MTNMLDVEIPDSVRTRLATKEDVLPVYVRGNGMLPIYRDGDCLLVSSSCSLKVGDRVVAKTARGAFIGGTLLYQSAEKLAIAAYSTSRRDHVLARDEIGYLGRVLWASQ